MGIDGLVGAARRRPWLLLALALAPMSVGIAGRLLRPKHLMSDFYAVACAGRLRLADQPVYARHPACPGLDAMPYNYHPWVADAAAAVIRTVGMGGFIAGYVALFCAAFLYLGWRVLFDPRAPGAAVERISMLALVTGSAVSWGNVALPVYALIALSLGWVESAPGLFVLVVVAASVIKPVFAANLLALLYAPGPLRLRLGWVAVGGVAALAPTAAALLTGGHEAAAWRDQLAWFVLHDAPGFSLLGWLKLLHLPTSGAGAAIACVLFAGLLALAGGWIAERGRMSAVGRAWLGLAVAALINPRLMRYDAFLIGPGTVALIHAARFASPATGRLVARATYGVLGAAWLLNLVAGGNQLFLCWLAFSALVIAVALRLGGARTVATIAPA